MENNLGPITIQTFNPFEAIYPGHKVISWDTLMLMKWLRSRNVEVEVEPQDDRPLEYLFRKGLAEFFSDPVVVNVASALSIGVAANLITAAINWVWNRRHSGVLQRRPDVTRLIIRSRGSSIAFTHSGEPLGPEFIDRLLAGFGKEIGAFGNASARRSPHADMPVPLFIEHRPEIVGWCDLGVDRRGLLAKRAIIFDDLVWTMVKRGDLRGLSIGGIAVKSTCTICKGDYVRCNHVSGEIYEGKKCSNKLSRMLLADVSLVQTPANSHCFLTLMKEAGTEAHTAL